MQKSILVGLHDEIWSKTVQIFGPKLGYTVDLAASVENMDYLLGNNRYSKIIMDLNLGKPADIDISPAIKIYRAVKKDIDTGFTDFIAISGLEETVSSAKKQGIPAIFKDRFSLRDYLT